MTVLPVICAVVSSGNNKKSARESPFSALVVLLCFIGGYLPSRVFGFNNLLVFVLPLYLVFDVSVSLYEYYFRGIKTFATATDKAIRTHLYEPRKL